MRHHEGGRVNEALVISKDKNKIDIDAVINYLQQESYWAKKRSQDKIIISINNSMCYSLLLHNEFIGFARVITDYCTFSYLCDVFIATEYQHCRYGHKLMEFILNDDEIKGTPLFLLTQSAHEFYRKFGFKNEEDIVKRVMYKW
jgi:N-acetylglutamate synthase-like GNAT family acetyltransferase